MAERQVSKEIISGIVDLVTPLDVAADMSDEALMNLEKIINANIEFVGPELRTQAEQVLATITELLPKREAV